MKATVVKLIRATLDEQMMLPTKGAGKPGYAIQVFRDDGKSHFVESSFCSRNPAKQLNSLRVQAKKLAAANKVSFEDQSEA